MVLVFFYITLANTCLTVRKDVSLMMGTISRSPELFGGPLRWRLGSWPKTEPGGSTYYEAERQTQDPDSSRRGRMNWGSAVCVITSQIALRLIGSTIGGQYCTLGFVALLYYYTIV
jgi:hypothetical protein